MGVAIGKVHERVAGVVAHVIEHGLKIGATEAFELNVVNAQRAFGGVVLDADNAGVALQYGDVVTAVASEQVVQLGQKLAELARTTAAGVDSQREFQMFAALPGQVQAAVDVPCWRVPLPLAASLLLHKALQDLLPR